MRIAMVTDYYLPTLGGVQTAIKAQSEMLRAAGHEVTVFCPLAQPSQDPHVVALPAAKFFRPDGYPLTIGTGRATAIMKREFAERKIDVVHTNSELFASLAGVRAARFHNLPIVHTMHGRADVYAQSVLPLPHLVSGPLARIHGRHASAKGIKIRRDLHYTKTATARRMWRMLLAQARLSAHVIVPSSHFHDKFLAQGIETPSTVMSNTLEESVREKIGEPVPRKLKPGEPMRVIWVGRLSPEKRPDIFARAVAQVGGDKIDAHIYGEGMHRREVEKVGGPAVLHGSVPQHQVLAAMRDAHLLVSTSYDFDNQPMVMLEAVASGLPVMFCDPDLAEVVPDGAGFLSETPEAAGLAASLQALLDNPAEIARASAAAIAGRERVFSDCRELEKIYAEVLAGHDTADSAA
ncbi:MAG: glycosyltransferase [Microbacteriaceae bacterium]|nr:glycosyltransferase [Microbacteriaceae bacterium]